MKQDNEIVCRGGVFSLPDELFVSLKRACPTGVLYIRQDEETVVISPQPIADGRRRQLNRRYRAEIFRNATRLVLVDAGETIRLMAVQWRAPKADDGLPLDGNRQ